MNNTWISYALLLGKIVFNLKDKYVASRWQIPDLLGTKNYCLNFCDIGSISSAISSIDRIIKNVELQGDNCLVLQE